ncbi:MAG: tRNA uridine-5-carboxymethylaminomethyl(34) synthesis GTPase MnmE [Pyrinomonadaceae bacterium]
MIGSNITTITTIVALATPPGRSGIGVIRLSGPEASQYATTLISRASVSRPTLQHTFLPGRAQLFKLRSPEDGEFLDHAIITYFKAPKSFTGEDVIEISCHGAPVILDQLIGILLRLGARTAEPGEFTLRAVRNGRMNLTQAEAIRDLIEARTGTAARQAQRQLKGELSGDLQSIKSRLLEIIVPLESALEFVEDDLPEIKLNEFAASTHQLRKKIDELAATFHSGRLLKDGLKVAFAGRPNVGKSSLFNALLLKDRAIVTNYPGTTRDSLNESVNINGVPIVFTDTAGLRSSSDEIESLGVERARRAIFDSDLVLVVIDGSQPLTAEDQSVLADITDTPHIIIINKKDLGRAVDRIGTPEAETSAVSGEGIDELKGVILDLAGATNINDGSYLITNARHRDLLLRTSNELLESEQLLESKASEEVVLIGLYNALKYLGQITGETTSEDVLTQIFTTFCIGK